MNRCLVACALLAATTPVARADGPDAAGAAADLRAHPHDQGLELRLWSLRARGVSLDYERRLIDRISATAGIGLRRTARGDYSGRASTLSLALRYWPADGAARRWMRGPMAGAYAEAFFDLQRTTVRDTVDDEDLPSTHTVAAGAGLGFRIVLWQRVTITPHAAGLLRTDVPSGRGRSETRPTVRYGLRVGAVF